MFVYNFKFPQILASKRLLIGLTTIIGLVGLVGLIALVKNSNQTVSQLSESSLEKIAKENSELSAKDLELNISRLWQKDNHEVLWIDFNHQGLCGINHHCLYAMYHRYGESVTLVWRSYLDPRLPPKVKLMEEQKPCVIINQLDETSPKNLNKYHLCPVDTNQYEVTKKVTTKIN
ncbi:hypothetical protein [Crocosphaera chwakensis]|uniref:Uncharacterized protein n=1 Tax=Crocosphaera chwakensis CCY0110 TaxID=391612 RepID=A3IZE4_9CHRO|nr:hypothetical protein [Crocosphaera chwakensis]EAZ88156.1 hypothetical protein CY0110_14770 [Crocosphaera chwakensis CCY0110]